MNTSITIYVVLAVALAVWISLFIYLWRLDALAHELRRRLDRQHTYEEAPSEPKATLERRSAMDEQA